MITLVKKHRQFVLTVKKGSKQETMKLSFKDVAKLFCLVSSVICRVINK